MSKHPQVVQPRLFNIEGAAQYLGVSPRLVEQFIETKRLKTKRLEHPFKENEFVQKTLIERAELDRLADAGITI